MNKLANSLFFIFIHFGLPAITRQWSNNFGWNRLLPSLDWEEQQRILDEAKAQTACLNECKGNFDRDILRDGDACWALDSPFDIIEPDHNTTVLDNTCRRYEKASDCFNRCRSTPPSMVLYEIACKKHRNMLNKYHASCFVNSGSLTIELCQYRCGAIEALPRVLRSTTPFYSNPATIRQNLCTICNYFECVANCSRQIFTAICASKAEAAGDFFQMVIVNSVQSMVGNNIDRLKRAIRMDTLPCRCRAFIFNKSGDKEINDSERKQSSERESGGVVKGIGRVWEVSFVRNVSLISHLNETTVHFQQEFIDS